jgi:23S rRNA A2030 N6-methylase RlmJ
MSYDSFLVPICELKSEDFNSTGTKIEQTGDDGSMELEDGYLKVKNKLPIKVI